MSLFALTIQDSTQGPPASETAGCSLATNVLNKPSGDSDALTYDMGGPSITPGAFGTQYPRVASEFPMTTSSGLPQPGPFS